MRSVLRAPQELLIEPDQFETTVPAVPYSVGDTGRTRDSLRAIMFTDIVGSVSLSSRFGERVY